MTAGQVQEPKSLCIWNMFDDATDIKSTYLAEDRNARKWISEVYSKKEDNLCH